MNFSGGLMQHPLVYLPVTLPVSFSQFFSLGALGDRGACLKLEASQFRFSSDPLQIGAYQCGDALFSATGGVEVGLA